jgi:VanZ family protein
MQRAKHLTHIRPNLLRLLFLASGLSGIFFFAADDFMHHGISPHIGTRQLAGLVVSAIIVLSGLRTTTSSHAKSWFGSLLLIYLAGLLFMGLKPSGYILHYHRGLLAASGLSAIDCIVNILGFVPYAYLHMAYLFSRERIGRTAVALLIVLGSGTAISLFIELAQYYIPGRTSSLIDLATNAVGTLIGILYFLMANTAQAAKPGPIRNNK